MTLRGKPKSEFYQRIYAIVAQIPAGMVVTYGQIALLAGRPLAARQVGYAMSAVPADHPFPCHRVVNRLGELAPDHVFGDKRFQRMLLEKEGVTFLPDGRIDLKKHLWVGQNLEDTRP
ncbi:methylated-DNA--[protein]-cysteine S-methyltransferase [Desulfosarcina sp. OttesenSCG-928-G10]|nr:methylated-DNA--[protein]-cysteine S-methyltransferase [Desulfosarcina sp. OttesenSCG-928-G10]